MGCFLVVAIGGNRLGRIPDPEDPHSGTGGFALVGTSTLGVVEDLNSSAGQEAYALDPDLFSAVRVVPLRVRDGDEASCLNLNQVQNPRLVGVDPGLLEGRFRFADHLEVEPGRDPWSLLEGGGEDGVVPAVGDQASVAWVLHKKVGDSLSYTDEDGRPFEVRIVATVANSILQGNLVIAEEDFRRIAPSRSGDRMFLVDAPPGIRDAVARELVRGLQDLGLSVIPAALRLAEFNAVQNTYLSIFQFLGGLGLLLGSAGLAVVVLRNVLERRGELALLEVLGFPARSLRWLLLAEHGVLLLGGMGLGVVSALLAILPALRGPGADLPVLLPASLVLVVTLAGVLWVFLASWIATRGSLLDALESEAA
jgi:hypothetical protein